MMQGSPRAWDACWSCARGRCAQSRPAGLGWLLAGFGGLRRLVLAQRSRELLTQLVGNRNVGVDVALVHGVELREHEVVVLGEFLHRAIRALGVAGNRG